jgi:hypothetical protein
MYAAWTGLLVAALLGLAGDAPALPRLAPAPAGLDAVAYAGADRVYATGRAVMRVRPGERPLRIATLRGRAIQLDASPAMGAVVERRGGARRLLTGPPSGPLQVRASCRGRYPEIPFAPLAVAGDVVAEALSCERARGAYNGAPSIRLHDAAGVRTVQAPAGERFVVLAGAPGALAWTIQAAALEGPVRVEVADPASGAVRYGVPGLPDPLLAGGLAVQADGSSLFCGPGERLAWASPAAPGAHAVGGVRCPVDVGLASGQVAYRAEHEDEIRVAGLDGRARTLIRGAGGLPFDWDGAHLLVAGLGCGADFLGERAAAGAAYRGRACTVRIRGVARGRSRRSARVIVACRPGCRGEVQLQLGHAGRYHAATLRLRHAGRRAVRVPLGRRAARLLRDYREVPFHAAAAYVNPVDGALSMPQVERSGHLAGDGALPFPPAAPRGGD